MAHLYTVVYPLPPSPRGNPPLIKLMKPISFNFKRHAALMASLAVDNLEILTYVHVALLPSHDMPTPTLP